MKASFKTKTLVLKLLLFCIITTLFALGIATLGFGEGGKEEEKVVDFVILGYSPHTLPLYQEAVEDYEAANPGVDINLQNVSWSIAHEKIFSWVNTGNVPAASVIGPKWIFWMSLLKRSRNTGPSVTRRPGKWPRVSGGV